MQGTGKRVGHNDLTGFFICRKAKPCNWLHVDFEYVTGFCLGLWEAKSCKLNRCGFCWRKRSARRIIGQRREIELDQMPVESAREKKFAILNKLLMVGHFRC